MFILAAAHRLNTRFTAERFRLVFQVLRTAPRLQSSRKQKMAERRSYFFYSKKESETNFGVRKCNSNENLGLCLLIQL